jgi:pimeloyl-ACP methyl ester carboxylesterase
MRKALLSLGFCIVFVLHGRCSAGEGQKISVGDHSLFLNCTGTSHGSTVILIAGSGDTSAIWSKVQPGVATFTKVCSYDRWGLGESDHLYSKQSVKQITQDLHTLLENGDVKPPYILVGHSVGGIYARNFASTYPASISGLVFVDSAHEEQVWRFAKISSSLLFEYPEYPDVWKLGQAGYLPDRRLLDWHLNVPLIVLEHGITWPRYDFKGMSPEQYQDLKVALSAMQVDLSRRSKYGELRRAEASGHYIQTQQPDLVVRAIHDVLGQVRDNTDTAR